MAKWQKYHGPCPDHPQFQHDCKHCKSIRERERARRLAQNPDVRIYRELHWPVVR